MGSSRGLSIEVKNLGDEVERLGERSRRVIALSSSLKVRSKR